MAQFWKACRMKENFRHQKRLIKTFFAFQLYSYIARHINETPVLKILESGFIVGKILIVTRTPLKFLMLCSQIHCHKNIPPIV